MAQPLFEFREIRDSHSRSRHTRGIVAEVQFFPLDHRPQLTLQAVIEELFQRLLAEYEQPPIRIGLQLQPPDYHDVFTIPLRPPLQNNPGTLAEAICRLNEQSAANIDLLAGNTRVRVLAVWPLGENRIDDQRAGNLFFCFFSK